MQPIFEKDQKILVIGDVHCKVDEYKSILDKHPELVSVQVGDFGLAYENHWHLDNIQSTRHKINFGNHDDTDFLFHPHSLRDFSLVREDVMSIRGAFSIDAWDRTIGVDYWEDEELNYKEFEEALDFYLTVKPNIVISHDCPYFIYSYFNGYYDNNRTASALEHFWNEHKPELWIFGHYHRSLCVYEDITNFVCLKELETTII